MGVKFTSEVSEKQDGNEKDGGRLWWEKWTSDIFSAPVIDSVRKYLINFDFIDIAITAHSSTENKVYRFWQKTKKQQPSLMGMWEKWTGLYFNPFGTKWHIYCFTCGENLLTMQHMCSQWSNYGYSFVAVLVRGDSFCMKKIKSCNLLWHQRVNTVYMLKDMHVISFRISFISFSEY